MPEVEEKKKPLPWAPSNLWWGSDCTMCGNATYGSMTCDSCQLDKHTVALFVGKKQAP